MDRAARMTADKHEPADGTRKCCPVLFGAMFDQQWYVKQVQQQSVVSKVLTPID